MADADRLAILHADTRVMNLLQHGVLTRAQSDALVANYEAEWPALGFGSWTASERASGRLVGLGGLRVHTGDYGVAIRLAFTPEAQDKGYGPELASAALTFAFEVAKLDRVVALTRSDNGPSRAAVLEHVLQTKPGGVGRKRRTEEVGEAGAGLGKELWPPEMIVTESGIVTPADAA